MAISDTLTVQVDTSVTIEALQNDFDPEGAGLTLDKVDQPSHGTATLVRAGQIDYTPEEGFVGTDTFSYEISDINDNKSTGTITVNVFEANESIYLPVVTANKSQQQVESSGWQRSK